MIIKILMLLCVLCISCNNASRKTVPIYLDGIDIYEEDTIEDITEEIPYDTDSIRCNLIVPDESSFPKDEIEVSNDKDVNIDAASPSMPSSKLYYQEMLESFCQKYYDTKYSGRHFVHNSLYVDGFRILGENIVEVCGTHTYQGHFRVSTYEQRDFEAIIRQEELCKFRITFTKKTRIHLLGLTLSTANETIDGPFTYNP